MEVPDHKTSICPSCGQPGTGAYCTGCSEVMHPQRITMKLILKSIPDILFDLEHGLLYTIPALIQKPGLTLRRFFEGDRARHYKPLKFLFFIVAVSTFLNLQFNIDFKDTGPGFYEDTFDDKSLGQLVDQYSMRVDQILLLCALPLISWLTWAFFKKKGFNYGEHVLANAFFIGEVTLYRIILFPVYLLLNNTSWVKFLNNMYLLWIFGYYVYAIFNWMYPKKTVKGFLYALLAVLTTYLVYILAILILVPVIVIIKINLFGR